MRMGKSYFHQHHINAMSWLRREIVKGHLEKDPCVVCGSRSDVSGWFFRIEPPAPYPFEWICRACRKRRRDREQGLESPMIHLHHDARPDLLLFADQWNQKVMEIKTDGLED